MNWPSIAGENTSGKTAAALPISLAGTISVAKRSSKVLVGSSRRDGSRSWTARSSAKLETAREKISASQNDRIILGREISTALRSQFNLIRGWKKAALFHLHPARQVRNGSLRQPAWRNWQTRWTQNPVIARSCGFEPLRRQLNTKKGRTDLPRSGLRINRS